MQLSYLKYLCFVLLFLGVGSVANSLRAQQYTLSNWTVEDGLSSDDVTDIIQSKDGMMWVATEHGLNKFDGYTFDKFRYHPADSTTIGANFIDHICDDGEGNIWVQLSVGIISRYNKLTRQFSNFTFHDGDGYIFETVDVPELGLLIASSRGLHLIADDVMKKIELRSGGEEIKIVYSIFQKSKEHYYLSTSAGFKKYNFSTNTIHPIFYTEKKDTIPFRGYVRKFYCDKKGMHWIQTQSGSLYQSRDGIHFHTSINRIKEKIERIRGRLFIFEDQEDVKWSYWRREGLLYYDTDSKSWKGSADSPDHPALAFEDGKGNLWICTKDNELYKKNKDNWELIFRLGDRLNHWEIRDIIVDAENGIWLATEGKGVWRIYNRKWPISSFKNGIDDELIDFEITALQQENEELIWLGTNNNLYKYNLNTEQLNPLFASGPTKNPLLNLNVNDIAEDHLGNLWLATSWGVVVTSKDGKNVRHIMTVEINDENIDLRYVRCLLADSAGRIWIGTVFGLFMHDPIDEKFYHYHSKGSPGHSIRGSNIQCLTQVEETSFLIGYIKYGVDHFSLHREEHTIANDQLTFELTRPAEFNLMTANTFYQSDNEIWLGTFSRGLLKIDLENRKIKVLSEDFPIIPNVKGIQKGRNGKLWVSSIDGIRSVDPNDLTYYRFTKSSGLLSNQFNLNSDLQDQKGNLYFGSAGGMNKIQPAEWNFQDTVSTPILTNFKTFDENIAFEKNLDKVETISLHHKADFIKFEFVSPTYHNPQDVQYAYQLEGFDPNWIYCEDQRSASYTNLNPGSYTFNIKAGNKGGFLNSKTKRIEVIITPPFWQTAWFILLVVALALLAIWLAYKVQSNIRNNRLKLATEVRKKAADDFHDELGHRLTKIVLFVESLMLQKDKFPAQSAHILRKIQDNANELYYSTKDFIWAMNPSKDSILELLILLRDFGEELYEDTPIQFAVEGFSEDLKDQMLGMDEKRQLTMIFKEAMNNALKHADCTEVILKVEQIKGQTKIGLSDNGRGFVLNHEKFGYGLGSMVNRSKKVGGHLEIISEPGAGTEVLLEMN